MQAQQQNVYSDIQLIKLVNNSWDANSKRAGTLVQRFETCFWHYGVALSDAVVIGWGPIQNSHMYYRGQLSIESLGLEFTDAIDVPYLNQTEILDNIIASIFAFHNKWEYGFQGWNCEHWARLVVSGQPISYQVKEQGLGIFDAFGVLHFRNEAIEHLKQFRRQLY